MTPARLTEIRKTLSLSQAALATRLGVHPQTISKWERGAEPLPHGDQLGLAMAALLAGLDPAD